MHTSEEKEVPLRAENDRVRDKWMQKITKAILEYMTTKKKMDREKEEQCKFSSSVIFTQALCKPVDRSACNIDVWEWLGVGLSL